ncbi:MAG: MBL fold metallo-hydrolase [bacterium]|nr:MBL fold metallo-hydrolase [bacterium]
MGMKLMFIGADHEVTGSCHYVEVGNTRFIVDYGMEQGVNVYENADLPVSPAELDFILITHAHIDHTGMLPLLGVKGFKGPIYATIPTCDLCEIMLRDTAHIQQMDAEWRNRKARRAGREEVPPIFTVADADAVLKNFVPCAYDTVVEVAEGVKIRFTDAGHLLGSASIEVWLTEDGTEKKIVFSGDIGNFHKPLIRDPQYIKEADYVVMESTYGNRYHKAGGNHTAQLAGIIQRTLDAGGNVVIPAFAVGRTQEILYFIRHIKEEGLVKGHDGFPVYVDSPLAVEATHIFKENMTICYDEETKALVERGVNPIFFDGLYLSVTSEESKAINFDMTPKVIISAAGMCDAGRIRHHLKYNLWRPECSVVFAGYQAEGTLGRLLMDGATSVKILGDTIDVQAKIEMIDGISGHADRGGLFRWIEAFEKKPAHVFVVHGEDSVCESFAADLHEKLGLLADAPFSGSEYDLKQGCFLRITQGVPLKKDSTPVKKAAPVFERLLAAGNRLLAVIRHNEGGANKDLAKFADQILALCEKWDR